MRKIRIDRVDEVDVGYRFRERVRNLPTGPFKFIQIRDFDDHCRLNTDSLIRIDRGREPGPSIARKADVLFLSPRHNLWATALPRLQEKAVISGYFYIVRPDPNVSDSGFSARSPDSRSTIARAPS